MSTGKPQTSTPKPDGRLLRSERSRQLIIDAMVALIEEGNLAPTAQQVADRAGVGIRSVFRHFEDMESIFTTTNEQFRGRAGPMFAKFDGDGSVAERILRSTEQRASVYETFKNMMLSGQSRRWSSPVLQKNYAKTNHLLRRNLDEWLPELQTLPSARREAADALTSFENWIRLRQHQGLSRKASIEVVVDMLTQLTAQTR